MTKRHKRHSSDLRFCSCTMCRYGMRDRHGSWFVQYQRRRQRRQAKALLRLGIEPPTRFGVPYTD